MNYYPPSPHFTGGLLDQPRAVQEIPGHALDHRYQMLYSGFLDAPSTIPTGSVRATDVDTLRLGTDYHWREQPKFPEDTP